jgi:CRP-like cAMP-binding protein
MLHRRVRGKVRLRQACSPHETTASAVTTPKNLLLGVLPPTVLARLTPHLEPVHLSQREVLFRAHEPLEFAYFPTTAVVSFVSTLESGESLEVGLVGNDGLAGTAVFPGITMMACDGVVQIPGVALRMSADVLRAEVLADETLTSTLGRFAQVLHVRCIHMSVCNMFHSVEQRCVRWLLTVDDVIHNGDLPLTHELMATMLGVHRPTVTLVLRSLHKAGLVNEARGRVVISDRDGLEQACCECYGEMRNEQRRLLGY